MAFEHQRSNARILSDEALRDGEVIAQRLLRIELGEIFANRAVKRRAFESGDDDPRRIDSRSAEVVVAERRSFEGHDADFGVCRKRLHHPRYLQKTRGQHRHAHGFAQAVLQ